MTQLKRSPSDALFDGITYLIVAIVLAVTLYPLLYALGASFTNPMTLFDGTFLLVPLGFNLNAYHAVLQNADIWTGYGNAVLYTVLGTAVNLVVTTLAAFPLSRSDFRGRGALTVFFSITMFFSGGMIPTYLTYRALGLYNNLWVMILPGAVSVWYMIMMRTYFQTSVPKEMTEAAAIDGCSITGTLVRIVLPLSKPILAVLVMYYAVGHWDEYFNPLIFLSSRRLFPLQLILREILIQDQMNGNAGMNEGVTVGQMLLSEGVKYASVVVASVPMLALYPFVQKYFVKGVMVGAIKG